MHPSVLYIYIYIRILVIPQIEMINSTGQIGQPPHSSGKPLINRNTRRMAGYNQKKYLEAPVPDSWADDYEPEVPQQKKKQQQPNARSQNWRARKDGGKPFPKKERTEEKGPMKITDPAEDSSSKVVKAKKEIVNDDPLWQEGPFGGTHPATRLYSQNYDFSTFPLLCERVYADLEAEEPRLRRQMPFCIFQHSMTSLLNATVIDHARTVNAEDRFADEESPLNLISPDTYIPGPINEYLKAVANTTTPQGDVIRTNIADAGIPQIHTPVADGEPDIPAGTFGVCDALSHNAYECYVSPYVTRRLVQETLDQNVAHAFPAWNPLPAGLFPANGTPTQNLFGYRPTVERLTAEDINCLQGLEFPNSTNMESRLQWSGELMTTLHTALICERRR